MPSLRLLEGGKFSPDQFSPVLVEEYDQVRLRFQRWGLIPAWAKEGKKQTPRVYAAADHIFEHSAYQEPIRKYRCLIPADGYYVEKHTSVGKQVFKLSRPDEGTFCFAGVYDTRVQADGTLNETFSIITTQASGKMSRFGLQMPLILPKKFEQEWLNPETSLGRISQLLYCAANHQLRVHPVQELQESLTKEVFGHVAA